MNPSGHDAIEEPDMWLCKHIINSPSYIGAELYLRKRKGWKYSADFLEHSLQKNPSDLVSVSYTHLTLPTMATV